MTRLGFVLRLARREARASRRRLLLLTAAVLTGVAALVAVNSFTTNMQRAVAEQAQALLGADLSLAGRRPLTEVPDLDAWLAPLRDGTPPATFATSVSMPAMAWSLDGYTRLAQLRTVDAGWPFYGRILTDPEGVWPRLQEGNGVLVDPSLLTVLDLTVGDSLGLGERTFVVLGTVLDVPGDVGLQFAFGARVFMATSALPSTGLLAFGSRARWETFIQLPPGVAAQDIAEQVRPTARVERYRVQTVADDRDRLTNQLTQLGNYLGLIALAALLLGGLGVASAVQVFIRRSLGSIAILRCLGATSGEVFAIYLLQAAGMGLLGSILGAGLGVLLQQAMPLVLADFIPVDVRVAVAPGAILTGVGLGLWTAIAFALLPLLAIRDIPPLVTLRRDLAQMPGTGRLPRTIALILVGLSVIGLAAIQVGSLRQGWWFAVGIAAALVVLRLTAWGVMAVARRMARPRWPYLLRQGIANLHRPANQTGTIIVALGFGVFVLATILIAQHNLLRDVRTGDLSGARPDLAVLDIQRDQAERVDSLLRHHGLPEAVSTPLIAMRLLEVRGTSIRDLLAANAADPASGSAGDDASDAPDGEGPHWAYRREYRSTWRAGTTDGERVVAGRWFDTTVRHDGRSPATAVEISMEQELASELGVGLGDPIVWDLQGVAIHSRITSLREVNWARFEPNFFVVFAPGALDDAPQTTVALLHVPDPLLRGQVQRDLVRIGANITSVDLGEVARSLESVVDRIVLAIRFMAFFSIATGIVVLIGAIASSRWQRIREGTLLRTLGATRRQVLVILSVEYAALGGAAALVGAVLAGGAGWALATFRFEVPFVLPTGPLALLAIGLVLLTTLVGLLNSLDVLRRPPLEVLRSD